MVVLILFSVAFVVVLVGYAFYKVSPLSAYLYADARASARSAGNLKKEDYHKLASSKDFKGFLTGLRGTSYEDCTECKNARDFHLFLEKKYLEEITEIGMDTPKELRRVMKAYIMKYEANGIKLLLKSKLKNMTLDEELLVPAGQMTDSIIEKLKTAETIADMAVVLQRTDFAPLFARDFWDGKNWEEVEMEIDGFVEKVYRNAITQAKIPEGKELTALWNEWALANALLLIIRAKLREISEERQQNIIETFGLGELNELPGIALEEITVEDLPEISVIKENQELVKSGNIIELEKAVNEYVFNKAKTLSMLHPEGAYPVFTYLIEKRKERKTLQLISNAVQEGLPQEKIMEMIQ